MAFKQLYFHRSAIIWGPWDCQWSGEADDNRIKSKTIIFIQTTDLGKLSTFIDFLSRYLSLNSPPLIPFSSSNTWIHRIICHCATCSCINLDPNSAIFLENIFLESVANHTSKVRTILWDTLYCSKNYITFKQNIDSLLPGGLWSVTRSVATDFWAWRPGPSLGPPNLTPKLQLPGFGPLFSQKGPYSIYIFGFPLKSGKIGNS